MNDAPKHPASLVHREIVLEQHLVSQLVQRQGYIERSPDDYDRPLALDKAGSNIDDALFAVREGSGGCTRLATGRALLCPAADRLPRGPVRASPPCPSGRCRL